MVNRQELIDRFGDTEFLRLLWYKTEREIPARLDALDSTLTSQRSRDWGALAQSLHKLRGLLANFLTAGNAVRALVQCENAVLKQNTEALTAAWPEFRRELEREILELNAWLAAEP